MLSELNRIARVFHEIFARKDFELVSAEQNLQAFGNFVAVFQSKSLTLIFIRDRSQIFVDVADASGEKNKRELNRVINRIDNSVPLTNDLNVLAEQLKIHYDEVCERLQGNVTP